MKINTRYLPKSLTKKDKKKQGNELMKSRRLYKKGIYHSRPKVSSFKSKKSNHIKNAEKMYHVDKIGATNELAKATGCKKNALAKIINKGAGAYYSSGSRPNQTAQSWGIARLASAITSGKAAAIDYNILEEGCKPKSKALTLAKKAKAKKTRKAPKVIVGGHKAVVQLNTFNDIVVYIKERTIDSNIDYEECGTINNTGSGYIIKVHDSSFTSGETRKHCNFTYYDTIIWHSHPQTSKFYPSLEDMLKSIKIQNNRIKYSLIFNKFGYWTLHSINHIEINDSLPKNITKLLDTLYFGTSKGQSYNAESIQIFINNMNRLLNNVLEISFTQYI